MDSGDDSDDIVLSRASVERARERDQMYGGALAERRREFLRHLRAVPGFVQSVRDQMRPGETYRAVVPAEIQRALRDGKLEHVHKKASGLFNGMIRESGGRRRIRRQVEWVREDVDPKALANLNSMAIQAGITELTEMMLELSRNVGLVLTGLHSDRVAEVKAGIRLYEQATAAVDEATRRGLLVAAAGELTRGREKLFEHLLGTLRLERASPTTVQAILRWASRGRIDEVEFAYLRELDERYPSLKEEVHYGNLATAYLFRVHVALGEERSALVGVEQAEAFYASLAEDLPDKVAMLPHEGDEGLNLSALASQAERLRPRLLELAVPGRDLIIDVDYEELHEDL